MSTMASQVTKKIGTHNGSFHCDEVLACSMLRVLPRLVPRKSISFTHKDVFEFYQT